MSENQDNIKQPLESTCNATYAEKYLFVGIVLVFCVFYIEGNLYRREKPHINTCGNKLLKILKVN